MKMLAIMQNHISTKIKEKIKEEICCYCSLIFGHMFILLVSAFITFIVLFYPELSYMLAISPKTPWGIITAHFTHANIESFTSNMIGLTSFLFIFALSNSYHSRFERKLRSYFFLGSHFYCTNTFSFT